MALAQRCVSEFPAKTRHRGDDYADLGLVQIEGRLDRGVVAEVFGSKKRVYQVGVGWDPAASNLTVSCTCPSVHHGPCKHIWATLKTLDSEYPGLVPGQRPLRVKVAAGEESSTVVAAAAAAPAPWREALTSVDWAQTQAEAPGDQPASSELFFTIDTKASERQKRLVILFQQRRPKADGGLTQPRPFELSRAARGVEPPALRRTLLQLIGSGPPASDDASDRVTCCEVIEPEVVAGALGELCETERFYRVDATGREHLLAWDGDKPWRVHLIIERAGDTWRLRGELKRGKARRPLEEPDAVLSCGVLLFLNRLALLAPGDVPWVTMLRQEGALTIPQGEESGLLDALWAMPNTPPITYPPELTWEHREDPPTPRLSLWPTFVRGKEVLAGRVGFVYGEEELHRGEKRRGVVDGQQRFILQRQPATEDQRWSEVLEVGLRERNAADVFNSEGELELLPERLPDVVEGLLKTGWQVVADGVPYRAAGELHVDVESGIDWFDLKGGADFDGCHVSLPTLLEAVQREQRFVDLDDGSRGALPSEWISRFKTFASLGEAVGDGFRFKNEQATLLDALLLEEETVFTDAEFEALRQKLRASTHPTPQAAPPSFLGTLRTYQQESLGWLHHLRSLGLSGCLADDMGLGKTVQCLALLAQRHEELSPGERRPNLVVMPRSLIFNWRQEAERFTPHLRVIEYTGTTRSLTELCRSHIALTTYGVVRRDIQELRDVELDYVILDEAQAIKNETSDVSKAARLLRARHRLAVTGTPVENRLAELGSLMTFLNPGLFGAQANTRELFKNEAAVDLIAAGVRPLILRRTKEQVLDELPPKTELTLYCEMSERQQELYDELRDHYRSVLTQRVDEVGLNRSKMQVLEALLRLRQAACHPGLVDPSFDDVTSGKLELLFEQIEAVVAEGHKGLIFSQFTSLLGMVRNQLDERGIRYTYLDGQTMDRQGKVQEFQNDPDCKLFLISLKAGGYGLNLIAASYVFILDPWWNPAVEAQAVDRAYRMGQKQRVFAYRLVSRGTVEEKILELQEHKRRIAEAIVSQENSVLANLTPEDLELLLA